MSWTTFPPSASKPFVLGTLRYRLEWARTRLTEALLAERTSAAGWTGELSDSALSTATAITALTIVGRADPAVAARTRDLLARGYEWLLAFQNGDGGWGDTTRSVSNISTTTLVWAALGLPEAEGAVNANAVQAAERWLVGAAGSLEPAKLVAAIERRYGRDRTFSIPILTMCALCGRLGPEREAWRRVRQLPFEIAALPQRWFGVLQLPVVSYALPALIAIGQVRHAKRPTANPIARWIRNATVRRTLEKLSRLQPENGGFLEATPLTSFVTMSLAASGLSAHPVVQRGVAFLEASARQYGGWPIDTNLATWVTTLAVNAVTETSGADDRGVVAPRPYAGEETVALSREARESVRAWLLRQQYRAEHPYTLAAPGGWAWTDLPGGVPDADDTAGAVLALLRIDSSTPEARSAIEAGVGWLLNLQNEDGGVPTFCRGWGRLPFDRSSPDITAHAVRAWLAAREVVSLRTQKRIERAIRRSVAFLRRTQREDGAWVPLWFGHQEDPADENPLYGTSRVVLALCQARAAARWDVSRMWIDSLHWLIKRQNADGGWSGAAGASSSVEESGLAIEALATAWLMGAEHTSEGAQLREALARGTLWLVGASDHEAWREPSPIGFYFAKLWYFERLYPLIFATAALRRLAAAADK